MTTDPVTQFYAPRARLVDVASEQVIGGALGGGQSGPAALDLISATITLVNSGTSQLKVVLNNQIFDDNGLPAAPPWLYNGLDRLRFGQRVRLDLAYGDQPWTKMIVAQINDMQFTFSATEGAQLTIVGEDLLCMLKRKPSADHPYPAGTTEEEIVRDVVTRAGGAPEFTGTAAITGGRGDDGWRVLDGPLVAWPEFTEPLPGVTHEKAKTFYEFLSVIADRLDYEVFVDFVRNYVPLDQPGEAPPPRPSGDDAGPADPRPNDVRLHFEPTRSRLSGSSPSFVVDLAWGLNLLEFTPKLKVWDLVTAVRVTGRDPKSIERVNQVIDEPSEVDAIIAADLGRVAGGPFLIPATELRREFFRDVPADAPLVVDFTNLGPQRARLLAEATLRGKAREMCTVKAVAIGFPSIRPGIHVDVTGMYAPFDGLYYVTKTVHTFDSEGYRTELALRRAGLQHPDQYAWSLASGRRPGVEAS